MLVPQKQNHNDEDYATIMSDNGLIEKTKKAANFGNRKLSKCYKYFFQDYSKFLPIQICVLETALFGQKTQKAFSVRFLLFVKKKMLLLKLTDMEF